MSDTPGNAVTGPSLFGIAISAAFLTQAPASRWTRARPASPTKVITDRPQVPAEGCDIDLPSVPPSAVIAISTARNESEVMLAILNLRISYLHPGVPAAPAPTQAAR